MRIRSRRGLTLVEVAIALAIAGLALLGGIQLLDQLNDESSRIGRESAATNSAGNLDRLLRRALADAHASSESLEGFHGEERSASFMSRCDVSGGWAESCRFTLLIDSLADSSVVFAEDNLGGHFSVRRSVGHVNFRYLDLGMADSSWVRRWAPSIAIPAAIALVGAGDTVVLPLGPARD